MPNLNGARENEFIDFSRVNFSFDFELYHYYISICKQIYIINQGVLKHIYKRKTTSIKDNVFYFFILDKKVRV